MAGKGKADKADSASKLGTFSGVFVPTTLYTFSILMFLRFGFILGQTGFIGFMGMLTSCFAVDVLTAMSISAIATNGTVRGGGAYYLISRSLGPEFGGAIGLVFYLGGALNTGMNSVGLVNCIKYNFGLETGLWSNWLPDSFWWCYLWSTIVLIVCTGICIAGSSAFSKASNGLLVILLISILSIPFSSLVRKPFENEKHRVTYTGLSLETLQGNLYPNFTSGADGSQLEGPETWQTLFGVLFPATAGIFAGSSMSGDLRTPSSSIPRGTFSGLLFTYVVYTMVILGMSSTITRQSLYNNVNIVQDVNLSGVVILVGEFATTFFGALMGIIGPSKLLQALAKDKLLPGLGAFTIGRGRNDEPVFAILLTFVIAQFAMLFDINQIAALVTMSLLMTFLVTNLACFLLKISAAPNFRPSFLFFSWHTAAFGVIVSGAIMFYADGIYASACFCGMIALFLIIHYTSPPKPWGDVSQGLIFHQVRKYLLRLRQEHVKFWRPSIILFINDPRKQYKLIQFSNSLKKGGLFILSHVIVTEDFKGSVPEARKQQASWTKYIDLSNIKAFINISVSPKVEWGFRNMVLNSGLGGMRPNMAIIGFYNLDDLRQRKPLIDIPSPQRSRNSSLRPVARKRETMVFGSTRIKANETLPTDGIRAEKAISAQTYVTILEDWILSLRINLAVARGFEDLQLPGPKPNLTEQLRFFLQKDEDHSSDRKYIDLWPVQMSYFAVLDNIGEQKKNILTSNFDTYTMILQLGSILSTVGSWERSFSLRISVFVEYENEVEQERQRVKSLLTSLRIKAEVRVFWLASGDLKTYEVIVNGKKDEEFAQTAKETNEVLESEPWWQEVEEARKEVSEAMLEMAQLEGQDNASRQGLQGQKIRKKFELTPKQLRKMVGRLKRKGSFGRLKDFNPEMKAQLSHLDPDLIAHYDAAESSDDETNISDEEDDDDTSSRTSTSVSGKTRDIPDIRGASPRRTRIEASSSQPISIRPERGRGRLLDVISDDTIRPYTGPSSPTSASPRRSVPLIRHQSLPKFTSRPVPPHRIATNDHEEAGPSIMFEEQVVPYSLPHLSRAPSSGLATPRESEPLLPSDSNSNPSEIPHIRSSDSLAQAFLHLQPEPDNFHNVSGFPSHQAIPLSFNDLPSRAQHLILNELMVSNSSPDQDGNGGAVVLFTTLPAPPAGTGESEEDSVRYLTDLEVLCQNLPPILLVHSNTVTVTVSL